MNDGISARVYSTEADQDVMRTRELRGLVNRGSGASGAALRCDPRETFFAAIATARVSAQVIAEEAGVIAGSGGALAALDELEITPVSLLDDGARVEAGAVVTEIRGTPKQIALAEERFVGLLAKPSGIATASARFVAEARGRLRVVAGAWKKLPFSQRDMIRHAAVVGGAAPRIAGWPFLYLDKNFVRMHGGIKGTMAAARQVEATTIIVQVRGEYGDIGDEAVEVVAGGATIVFVDTGHLEDAARVVEALGTRGLRRNVEVAFGGGVQIRDIAALLNVGVDIVDVGRAIVDAPLLDMRLDVVGVADR